ncbi:rubredoxin [Evansella vedderi]|uniref:Rubredoxin n=1 Tax=Evansella vedderi TaxID=38282 RepID=A0ABT9ZWT1_9BACI|nr:DNA alkylation repair protein [Evansella vedderi]MDQ0255694.1 rubredoxin [Evansella vedderi]
MTNPYLCPNCKTNRSRFNIIEQVATPVKMDPQSGEIIDKFTNENLDPFHTPYKGPSLKVQCGSCGLVEDERSFVKFAEHNQRQ